MRYVVAKTAGFCFGVKNAVRLAELSIGKNGDLWSVGDVIHNELVMDRLKKRGLKVADGVDAVTGGTLLVRSHGLPEADVKKAAEKGLKIIDGTCPYVKKIHKIAAENYAAGRQIVIVGEAGHPEITGINGWCGNSAIIIGGEADAERLAYFDNLCVVVQTTFNLSKWQEIRKIIESQPHKTVEIFETICYTTKGRQDEAAEIAGNSTKMLVLGSKKSSNTARLFEICKGVCTDTYLIEKPSDLKKIHFAKTDIVGITAGASAPGEYLAEVIEHMKIIDNEVRSEEFLKGIDASLSSYRKGRYIKGDIISIDSSGLHINIGGKKDGLVPKSELGGDAFDPAAYKLGDFIEGVITGEKSESGGILLSVEQALAIKEGNKAVEGIRGGEVFEVVIEKDVKGGIVSRLGNYSVFIPASQAAERFVADLKKFAGKKMKVIAVDIDDEKKKIVASAKKAIESERTAVEEAFWSTINIDQIVKGTVKRATQFGAFVEVNGFDCLAHITDLSWSRITKVEDVLKINKEYDFVVLIIDRDKKRVSLGYKQLLPKPWEIAATKYLVDTVVKAKVVRIAPFGAFVEIEPGIDALVPMSEISHTWIKNVNEALKVGQEIEGKVIKNDEDGRKITVSIKAIEPEPTGPSLQEQIEREIAEDEMAQAAASKRAKTAAKETAVNNTETASEAGNEGEAAAEKPKKKEPVVRTTTRPAAKPDAKAKFEAREQKAVRDPSKRGAKRGDRYETPDDGTVRQWSESTTNNPFADLLKDFQK